MVMYVQPQQTWRCAVILRANDHIFSKTWGQVLNEILKEELITLIIKVKFI